MGDNSSIGWTEATWNPVAGCSLVSAGCTNCYAMRMASRLEAMGQRKYAGLTKKVNGLPVWTGKVNCDEASLRVPLSWRRPRRVFVNSMSDLFHESVPLEFVDKVFAVMAFAGSHTYQVLTKRPERMAAYLARTGRNIEYLDRPAGELGLALRFDVGDGRPPIGLVPWPLPNVWLGTSVEDRATSSRLLHLELCPAAVRFVSFEPLLQDLGDVGPLDKVGWAIVGCESRGSRAGRMPLGGYERAAWRLINRLTTRGIPVFNKQMPDGKGGVTEHAADFPEGLRVQDFPRGYAVRATL